MTEADVISRTWILTAVKCAYLLCGAEWRMKKKIKRENELSLAFPKVWVKKVSLALSKGQKNIQNPE